MAAGMLPKPGSQYLCKGKCDHIDCGHIRADAAKVCRICQKPIGFERRFYRETGPDDKETGSLVHASCLEDEIDQQHKARLQNAVEAVQRVAAANR